LQADRPLLTNPLCLLQNVIPTLTEPFLDKSRPLGVVYIATHYASPPRNVTNTNRSQIQQG